MRDLPTDPLALQARVFGALCDDIHDMGAGRSRSFDRTNAIREILVQRDSAAGGPGSLEPDAGGGEVGSAPGGVLGAAPASEPRERSRR